MNDNKKTESATSRHSKKPGKNYSGGLMEEMLRIMRQCRDSGAKTPDFETMKKMMEDTFGEPIDCSKAMEQMSRNILQNEENK